MPKCGLDSQVAGQLAQWVQLLLLTAQRLGCLDRRRQPHHRRGLDPAFRDKRMHTQESDYL